MFCPKKIIKEKTMKGIFKNVFIMETPPFEHLKLSPTPNGRVVRYGLLLFAVMIFHACSSDGTEVLVDYDIDTDGDGIFDSQEVLAGTDKNNPCDPVHDATYDAYNPLNLLWQGGDCDGDGLTNAVELSLDSNPYGEPIIVDPAVPELLPNLSQLKLFQGNLADFEVNTNVFEYGLNTPLFTDYAYKLRVLAIPDGAKMTYNGDGLFNFPDNTIMAKTFFYLNDERDESLGKKIIETRVLIKKNGVWQVGNYIWNEAQTDAVLDPDAHVLQVDWVDGQGSAKALTYRVPSNNQCFQCHDNGGNAMPIGPKSRAMNFMHKGINLIQDLKSKGLLEGAPDITQIPVLPDWTDESLPLETRARAYLDVNCAHCHQTGGSYNVSFGNTFQLTYETSFEESNINGVKIAMKDRINTQIPGYFMPLIGTNVVHTEGVELLNAYIDSLE